MIVNFYDWCVDTFNEILLKEWIYEKNGEISPESEPYNSKNKVWWKCSDCGYEWETAICNRMRGHGCIECGRKKVSQARRRPSPGKSLEDMFPNLAKEWHPTKNKSLKPSEISIKSHEKVWWLGKCGHEWESVVSSRTSGTNCPFCSGQKVLAGYNDLATLFPTISAEWHPTKNGTLKPSDFRAKSNIKVWWRCSMCDHEWEAAISKRTDGQGCPECAKEWRISFPEKAIVYYLLQTDLSFKENYQSEWLEEFDLDIYVPEFNLGISYDGPLHQDMKKELRKNNVCEKNGTYLLRICDEKCIDVNVSLGMCIRRENSKDASLNNVIAELLKVLHGLYHINIPSELNVDVAKDRIHIYELMKMHRKNNSIVVQYPNLMKEWNYAKNGNLNPEYLLPGSEKKVWWSCNKYGHEWQAIINSRTRGSGCPICSNNQVLSGFNDLASCFPDLASEWHPTKNNPLTPEKVTKSSGKKVWWLCSVCKNEWEAPVYSRSGNGKNGCPKCGINENISKLRIPKQGNSLLERNPILAKEWHPVKNAPLSPDKIAFKSHLKVWWLGKCGHEWQAVVSSRSNGNGCPLCYQERRKMD